MRNVVAAAVACLTIVGLSVAADVQASSKKHISIPAQGLGLALQTLSEERDIHVVFISEDVNKLRTRGARGSLTVDEALIQLLDGTGLTYQYIDDETISILPMATAAAPGSKTSGLSAVGTELRIRLAQNQSQSGSSQSDSSSSSKEPSKDLPSAQDTRGAIPEVIVTAQKRKERVQDVPISIAVIGNEDIERRGLIGMEDYLRSVPGVNEIDIGPANNSIIVRGITTGPEFSAATVGHYFDETPITGAATIGGSIDVRPVDIERIEILRGPQGTAFGSASLSGTLRLIPARPRLNGFEGKVAVSYSDTTDFGSDNSMIQGVVNLPLVEDQFGLRAVGYRYDESGFYRNIAAQDPATIALAQRFGLSSFLAGHVQDDMGAVLTTGGRLAALWQPTDKLDLSMNFLTQTIESNGRPVATVSEFEQARLPIDPRIRIRDQTGEAADTDLDFLNLVLNYDLGWATLTSVGSWVEGGFESVNSSSAAFGTVSQAIIGDSEYYAGEVRLASQLEGRFQFLSGLFYSTENSASRDFTPWPGAPANNPRGTDPQRDTNNTGELDERAVFAEISYDLTEKLTATVGGRYFEFDRSTWTLREGGAVNVPLGTGVPVILEGGANDTSFKANLSYEPTSDSLLYASWSEGFRLGGPSPGLPEGSCDANNDGLIDGTNVSIASTRFIDSDFLDNYEIGGKFALFDRRLVIDMAVYHIDWTGLPARNVAAACGVAYTANIGEAISEGVEFQASLLVARGLRLDFGGGYTKAELSKDVPTQGWSEGQRLPGAPEVNANLSAQYDFPVAGHDVFLRADSMYAGEFYRGIGEVPNTQAGDYIKVDVRAGVMINKLSAELFVTNLTNEDAYTWRTFDAHLTTSTFGGLESTPYRGYRLRPRTMGIELRYSFE